MNDSDQHLTSLNGSRTDLGSARVLELRREFEAFHAMASHDMRSPLGAIVNYASLLEDDLQGVAAESVGFVGRIRKNALALAGVLDDLLAAAEVGQRPFRPERLDLSRLAERCTSSTANGVSCSCASLPSAWGDEALVALAMELTLREVARAVADSGRTLAIDGRRADRWVEVEVHAARDGDEVTNRRPLVEGLRSNERVRGVRRTSLAVVSQIVHLHGGRSFLDTTVDGVRGVLWTLPEPTCIAGATFASSPSTTGS